MITVTEANRRKVFKSAHPAYTENQKAWTIFIDAVDGQGGFLNGEYLDRYERELEGSFEKRKNAARYHNYSETLVTLYTRKIFATPVERRTKNPDLDAWLKNVDGGGTGMDAFMQRALTRALAVGHVGALVDKTQDAAAGPAKADDKGQVYATQYLPTAIQDWRARRDGSLAAVKLRECVENTDLLDDHVKGDESVQMLLWDDTNWVRVPHDKSQAITTAEHGLGVVPFATLIPKALERWDHVGKSLLGNANIIRAIFNRASEEDQVLRDQAFSVLTVNVGPEGDVAQTKTELGEDIGTTRALVVKGDVSYETPSMEVPKAIRDNVAFLIQEIYRMAFVKATRESLQAETAEAIRLKQDELKDFLTSIAAACHAFELQLIRFWCGWVSTDADAAAKLFADLDLVINYSTDYFLDDLGQDLINWALALKLELGPTMEKHIRLKAAHRLEPNLDDAETKKVETEIEAIANKPKPDPLAIAAALRQGAAGRVMPAKPADQQMPPGAAA